MKNTFVLVFVLFNVLAVSCANKSSSEQLTTPSQSKIHAVLHKKFNGLLNLPTIASPSLSDVDKLNPNAVIKGAIEGTAAKTVYLQELTKEKFILIDSAKVDEKGSFSFNVSSLTEPTLCFLTFNSANPPGIPLIVGKNNKLSLAIKNTGWITYTINGDKQNTLINELYHIYLNHDKNLQDFNREISEIDPSTVTDSLREAVGNRFQSMQKNRTDAIIKFVSSREGSPASYYAVIFLFQEPNFSLMQVAYDKLKMTLPNSKYTNDLKTTIESIAPLEVGGMAPEINLRNLDGLEVSLSSLRGKIVLIDFWASWCGPCRKDNPHNVKLYNQYKSKGFEIFGVSLDDNLDKWKAAVIKDGLTWKHVSDLKGWQSSAAKKYQVNSIPFTVLLDKNGRIIAKGLRGEELDAKLAELL